VTVLSPTAFAAWKIKGFGARVNPSFLMRVHEISTQTFFSFVEEQKMSFIFCTIEGFLSN